MADVTQSRSHYHTAGINGIHSGVEDSIIQVAGAGFRLSLLLNAAATDLADADYDIRNVAKGISCFSLMLKQVGKTMRDGRSIASQNAIETATEIKEQSERVFEEVRGMVDFEQGRDEKGNIRSITILERVKWRFKKYKVQYLLGQLESLKLSLSIMLQILQMGKTMAATRNDPSKPPLEDKALLQEKAEIQSMMVVQHWSLVELRRLYELAEKEANEEPSSPLLDDPPPSYDAHRSLEESYDAQKVHDSVHDSTDHRLSLTVHHTPPVPPKVEDNAHAMVKYQEKPLHQLDASFTKALARENRVLNAGVYDIVDHLLGEWTRIPEIESRPPPPRDPRRKAYYHSEDDDTSDSEFERSEYIRGIYIEGPRRSHKKNVHFHARVESDSEEAERDRPRARAPKKHVLHSEDDSTSEDSESMSPPHRSGLASRRSSDAGSYHGQNPQEAYQRNPRPYASGALSNVPEDPARSSNRGIPPPPMPVPSRPMMANQQWPLTPQGTPSTPGFRPPYPPAGGSQRTTPSGSYAPPPGYMGSPSPQPQPGAYFPPRMPGSPMVYNQQLSPNQQMPPAQRPPPRHHRSHRRDDREKDRIEKEKTERANQSSKNLKRGLFGGAAVAGILDLLQGLDGL